MEKILNISFYIKDLEMDLMLKPIGINVTYNKIY